MPRLRVLKCLLQFEAQERSVNSMQKENARVPPPWGDDMEEALMAQAEAIRKNIRTPSSLVIVVSIYYFGGLGLIIATIPVWFLLAFAMRHSHAAGLRAIRNDSDRSSREALRCYG
jgi:hypothetical protein